QSQRQRKRKLAARPPPILFKPTDYKAAELVKYGEHTFGFRKQVFSYGLLAKFFTEGALFSANVLPAELEVPFSTSNHPVIRKFPAPRPEFWEFAVGDYVACDQPDLPVYLYGYVEEVSDDQRHCVLEMASDDSDMSDLRVVSTRHLKKVFEPGDYVSVVAGRHKGREGLVLEKADSFVGVLERHRTSSTPDFYVHVNSVARSAVSFSAIDIPWRDVRVVILKQGRFLGMQGLVKDVLRSTSRLMLLLTIYVMDFDCTEQFRYNDVVEYRYACFGS
ncbi:hypothetical protein MPER_07709, partial [Moniliophthora perniciosa FA553]